MNNFSQLMELSQTLNSQFEAYSNRPTKAQSKRMRATINEMKKLATAAKQDLVEADKG